MITAVVVTHSGSPELLRSCVDALVAPKRLHSVVVVANGPAPDAAMDVAAAVPEVHLVITENRGFGAAVNAGLEHVGVADVVVVANDDAVAQPGWLDPLITALDEPTVGAAQPVLTRNGEVASCGVVVDRYAAGSDAGAERPAPAGDPVELALFSGGFVAFDRAFLRQTGGFDERFFLYYEDVDLGRRGRRLGWSYRLVPASRVEHVGGVTTSQQPDRTLYLQERNRLWSAFRWESPATVGRAVWLSVRRLRRRPIGVHVRALAVGVAGSVPWLWARLRARRSA